MEAGRPVLPLFAPAVIETPDASALAHTCSRAFRRRWPETQAGPGFSRPGDVLRCRHAEPAVDCRGRQRRPQLAGHLGHRSADHLFSAGALRHGAVVALSAGRRHVCLEQARLRRLRGIHHWVDVLEQQPAVFSGHPVLRSQQLAVCRRQPLAKGANQPDIFHHVFAFRHCPGAAGEHRWAGHRQMAEQRWRHRRVAADCAAMRSRRHRLVEVRLRHPFHGVVA